MVARKKANDQRITALVDAGAVPAGWHMAYGFYSDFNVEGIRELMDSKKVNRMKLMIALRLLEEEIQRVDAKIANATAEAA